MKKSKTQSEFLMLKIKTPQNVDFYKEHKTVIKEYGAVDFAKMGKSIICTGQLHKGDIVFIKDSVKNGGTLYVAKFEQIKSNGEYIPNYYNELEIDNAIWMSFSELEIVKDPKCLDEYETRKGVSVEKALKSMSPNFYIHKKEA